MVLSGINYYGVGHSGVSALTFFLRTRASACDGHSSGKVYEKTEEFWKKLDVSK